MKSGTSDMVEGAEAWRRFDNAMRHIITVPHAEIQKRVEAHRRESAKNPNRRGPKPKRKR